MKCALTTRFQYKSGCFSSNLFWRIIFYVDWLKKALLTLRKPPSVLSWLRYSSLRFIMIGQIHSTSLFLISLSLCSWITILGNVRFWDGDGLYYRKPLISFSSLLLSASKLRLQARRISSGLILSSSAFLILSIKLKK